MILLFGWNDGLDLLEAGELSDDMKMISIQMFKANVDNAFPLRMIALPYTFTLLLFDCIQLKLPGYPCYPCFILSMFSLMYWVGLFGSGSI